MLLVPTLLEGGGGAKPEPPGPPVCPVPCPILLSQGLVVSVTTIGGGVVPPVTTLLTTSG